MLFSSKPVSTARMASLRKLHVVKATTEVKGSAVPLSGPEPKRFAVADGQLSNIAGASIPTLLRLATGLTVVGYKFSLVDDDGKYGVARFGGKRTDESSAILATLPRPAKPLELYQFHSCPYCKLVREAINVLDLDVVVYPTPRNGPNFRPKVIAEGGKAQFPYLVDPNTGAKMYESADIVKYLFATYATPEVAIPWTLRSGLFLVITGLLGTLARAGKGGMYEKSKVTKDTKPIVFYGYEPSPFSAIVLERLSALEVPFLWRTTARGSVKRTELFEKRGLFQAPYIEDPNTGVAMFESSAIIKHLDETYKA